MAKYDIFLQNKAGKQEFVIRECEDSSTVSLYHKFEGFEMPDSALDGEYVIAVVPFREGDVHLDDVLLNSTYDDGTKLCSLCPEVNIMRYGNYEKRTTGRNKNTEYLYRK